MLVSNSYFNKATKGNLCSYASKPRNSHLIKAIPRRRKEITWYVFVILEIWKELAHFLCVEYLREHNEGFGRRKVFWVWERSRNRIAEECSMLETLDYTIRIGSTATFLYFDLYRYDR